ncbi:MAG: F-box protein [Parachlamydia sp.]|nr:F-box protein [Parachlamydia sp.]
MFQVSNISIPDEVLCHMFAFLSPKERAVIANVCRAFNRVSHDKSFFMDAYGPSLMEALGGKEAVRKLPEKSLANWGEVNGIAATALSHPIMRGIVGHTEVLLFRFTNQAESSEVAAFFGSLPGNWQPSSPPKIFVTKPLSQFLLSKDTLHKNINIINHLVRGQAVSRVVYGYPKPVPSTMSEEEWSYMESAWRESEPTAPLVKLKA